MNNDLVPAAEVTERDKVNALIYYKEAQQHARFMQQLRDVDRRKDVAHDAWSHRYDPVTVLYVWRNNLWQLLAFIAHAPLPCRFPRWRKRYRVRPDEITRAIDIETAVRLPARWHHEPPIYTGAHMHYRGLLADSVLVPEQEHGRAFQQTQILGSGAVVGIVENKVSVITGYANEIRVRWIDSTGRESYGFLAQHTPFSKHVGVRVLLYMPPQDRVTAWDSVRHFVGQHATLRFTDWLYRFGAKNVPLLHAAIKELGGVVPASVDATTSIVKLLHLTTKENLTMSDVANAVAAEGKATSKKARAAAPVEATTSTKKNKKAKSGKKTAKKAKTATAEMSPMVRKAGKKSGKKVVATSKKAATAKTAKKVSTAQREAPGRTSQYSGKVIVKLVDSNPRREDTAGWHSWNVLRKGMTYEQYIAGGGRRVDLAWDLDKGNCKLVNKAKA